ncbi:glycosyltransferase family 4 protein [Gammaproteobacteria bacterium]|nr:glycosyltransferase family 4 protein [Gammaproteobacteria bacterium]
MSGVTQVYYVTPSYFPSRAANSVHVVNMVEGFIQNDYKVNFFFATNLTGFDELKTHFAAQYELKLNLNLNLIPFISSQPRFTEFFIGLKAILKFGRDLFRRAGPMLIYCRNIYAAFFFCLLTREKVFYETHAVEKGFRLWLQKFILGKHRATCVAISKALRERLIRNVGAVDPKIIVAHDAARLRRDSIEKLAISEPMSLAYFGHLYEGRGIEIIEKLAESNEDKFFVVYGGEDEQIAIRRNKNANLDNLEFAGYINHSEVFKKMLLHHVLLMPYQEKVYVGSYSIMDTASWMSPMKMFEYMSARRAIVSSELPVLKEVLKDRHNALLVAPNDINEWNTAIKSLAENSDLYEGIASRAYEQYLSVYNWKARVKKIISTAETVL